MAESPYNFDHTIAALYGMKAAVNVYASSADAWEIINRLVAAMEVGPGPTQGNGTLSQHVAAGIRNFIENKPLPTRPEA